MSCTPNSNSTTECGFSNYEKKFFTEPHEKWIELLLKGKTPFFKIDVNNEFLDYLEEFPVIELKKGTVICHTSTNIGIEQIRDYPTKKVIEEKVDVNKALWWNKYYPGIADNKGGWFTFEDSFGGPQYPLQLYYEIQRDVSLLFIPPIYLDYLNEKNTEYFPEEDLFKIEKTLRFFKIESELKGLINYYHDNDYSENIDEHFRKNFIKLYDEYSSEIKISDKVKELYTLLKENKQFSEIDVKKYMWDVLFFISDIYRNEDKHIIIQAEKMFKGSHIFRGVKGWKEKGYSEISFNNRSSMKGLAEKLQTLGFNGYVSCDFCEVFLTFDIMKKVLSRPFFVNYVGNESEKEKSKIINNFLYDYNSRYYDRVEMKVLEELKEQNFQDLSVLKNKDFSNITFERVDNDYLIASYGIFKNVNK